MASAAQRAPRRDLEPHWRDKLAESVRRFARRIEETLSRFLGREILLSFQTGSVSPQREPVAPLPPSPSS